MLDEIEIVRARAAARARAVRVTDGVASDRSLIETDYMTWLNAIFPEQMSGYRELADFHHDLLTHDWAIRRGIRPQAFFAIWFRGAGKSTLGEMIAVMLGALEHRKEWSTQDIGREKPQRVKKKALRKFMMIPLTPTKL